MSLEGGREGRGGEGRGGEGRGGEGRRGEGRGGEGSLRPMYFRKHELFRVKAQYMLNNTFMTIKTSFINYLPSNYVTLG